MVSPPSPDNSPVLKGQDAIAIDHNAGVGEKEVQFFGLEDRKQAEKRLVRLLDMRLLPTVVLIIIMNYIDVSGQR